MATCAVRFCVPTWVFIRLSCSVWYDVRLQRAPECDIGTSKCRPSWLPPLSAQVCISNLSGDLNQGELLQAPSWSVVARATSRLGCICTATFCQQQPHAERTCRICHGRSQPLCCCHAMHAPCRAWGMSGLCLRSARPAPLSSRLACRPSAATPPQQMSPAVDEGHHSVRASQHRLSQLSGRIGGTAEEKTLHVS